MGFRKLELMWVPVWCVQISNNIINTPGGGIQVGGEYIYTSTYLMNNITISGNTIYNTQFGTISVFTASNVSTACGGLSPCHSGSASGGKGSCPRGVGALHVEAMLHPRAWLGASEARRRPQCTVAGLACLHAEACHWHARRRELQCSVLVG